METITKSGDGVINAEDIKCKLYMLKLGEQLKIETNSCVRIYERIL